MANETTFTKITDIATHVTHYYRHDTHPYGGKPGEIRTEELTREEWETEREMVELLRSLGL